MMVDISRARIVPRPLTLKGVSQIQEGFALGSTSPDQNYSAMCEDGYAIATALLRANGAIEEVLQVLIETAADRCNCELGFQCQGHAALDSLRRALLKPE